MRIVITISHIYDLESSINSGIHLNTRARRGNTLK